MFYKHMVHLEGFKMSSICPLIYISSLVLGNKLAYYSGF